MAEEILNDQTTRLHGCHVYWATLAERENDPSRKAFAKLQEETDKRLLAKVDPELVEQVPDSKKSCAIV